MTAHYGAIISVMAFILFVGGAMLLYFAVRFVKAVSTSLPGDRARDDV